MKTVYVTDTKAARFIIGHRSPFVLYRAPLPLSWCALSCPLRWSLPQRLPDLQQRLRISVGNAGSCLTQMAKISLVECLFFSQSTFIEFDVPYPIPFENSPHHHCNCTVSFGSSCGSRETHQRCPPMSGSLEGLVDGAEQRECWWVPL